MIEQEILETAKKRLISRGKLFITGMEDEKFDSPDKVIGKLYEIGSYKTSHSNSKRAQNTGPARSIGDMCKVILHYFPDASIEDCVKAIYSAKFKGHYGDNYIVLGGYCTTVKKMVHTSNSNKDRERMINNRSHEDHGSSLYGIRYRELMRHCGIIR